MGGQSSQIEILLLTENFILELVTSAGNLYCCTWRNGRNKKIKSASEEAHRNGDRQVGDRKRDKEKC
jgi:hypothetical protein